MNGYYGDLARLGFLLGLKVFEDNGIGINLKRHKDRVFGLYQRFHNHQNSKGLGLYLVKSQLETLGARIEIESRVDEGTKFFIKFKEKIENE